MPSSETIEGLKASHRRRRFAMRIQQKLDRPLESFIRFQATDWNPNDDEAARERANAEAKKLIKRIRAGEPHPCAGEVVAIDKARLNFDNMRAAHEKEMEKTAKTLPVYPWLQRIRGAGALGLATIVAEAGDLSKYDKPCKLWKQLGFAPYDGCAGTTWMRESWRPRTLSKAEWTAFRFSSQRYSLMQQIAQYLFMHQWIGGSKTEDGEGRPNGPYGEIYAKRRAHTAVTHPEWSALHAHRDAQRVMMKEFLQHLWTEWHRCAAVQRPVRSRPRLRRD